MILVERVWDVACENLTWSFVGLVVGLAVGALVSRWWCCRDRFRKRY